MNKRNLRKRSAYCLKMWAKRVKERDEHTCQICYTKEGQMDAHHYVSLHEISDDREKVKDISNGVTLCVPCHTKFHKQYGSKGNTREQFEEYAYFEKEYKVKCNTISQQLEQIRS